MTKRVSYTLDDFTLMPEPRYLKAGEERTYWWQSPNAMLCDGFDVFGDIVVTGMFSGMENMLHESHYPSTWMTVDIPGGRTPPRSGSTATSGRTFGKPVEMGPGLGLTITVKARSVGEWNVRFEGLER